MRLLSPAALFLLCLAAPPAGCSTRGTEPTYLTSELEGEPVLIVVRTEARVAELQLMVPDPERLAVGTRCGYAGHPPPGAQAIWLLVRLKDVDALARLTQAPTLEGRLYAHIGLQELGVLDDAQLAESANGVPSPVWTCDGCMVGSASAVEALATFGLLDD